MLRMYFYIIILKIYNDDKNKLVYIERDKNLKFKIKKKNDTSLALMDGAGVSPPGRFLQPNRRGNRKIFFFLIIIIIRKDVVI